MQRELDLLPLQIEELEAELLALQTEISQPEFYAQDTEKVNERLAFMQAQEDKLEQYMERWIEVEAMQEG
jgi:ATP-binding cassette subfamily F protein uup